MFPCLCVCESFGLMVVWLLSFAFVCPCLFVVGQCVVVGRVRFVCVGCLCCCVFVIVCVCACGCLFVSV